MPNPNPNPEPTPPKPGALRRHATAEEKAQVRQMTLAGKTQRAIALVTGFNVNTVRLWQRRQGLPTQQPLFILPAKTGKEILQRLRRGQSQRKIATAVHVSPWSVRCVARRNGIVDRYHLSPERREKILREIRRRRWTGRALAKRFSINPSTAFKLLREGRA